MMKIKELRIKKGISQKEMAQLLNLNISDLCKWELEEFYPSIPILIEIANFLEVSIDELCGLTNN